MLILSGCALICRAETYWDVQADYKEALSRGDGEAIISCVKRIEAVYKGVNTEQAYMRLATPCEKAALEYEKKTMYSEAHAYYEKALKYYTALDKMGHDYADKLKCLNAMLAHLTDENLAVFAEANTPYPYYGAINEPDGGTYFGSCGTHPGEDSGRLIYVHYYNENIYDYARRLPDDTDDLIEIAWNMPKENITELRGVVKAEYRDYLERNIDWLAEQKEYRFLLRFAAEVNCWTNLDSYTKREYTTAFKDAFRTVADYVHEVAPNVAMVYSPTAVSNWNYDLTDFYPGDKYVDWVGISTYNNYSSSVSAGIGSQTDAFYSRGEYENQIERIRHAATAFPNKPIVISECGFCHFSTYKTETAEHAADSLKYFYTYVNRVFPQVKAIYYFNTNFGGEHYTLSENDKVLAAYKDAVGSNISMQASLKGKGKYYVPLERLEKTDTLRLSAYDSYPGGEYKISYIIDGKTVFTGEKYPYEYTATNLSEGLHRLTVRSEKGKTAREREYTLYVAADGSLSASVSAMMDVSPSAWYAESVAYCMHKDIFRGVSDASFAPEVVLTRGMLVTLLYRMEGSPKVTGKHPFTDVAEGKWYADAVTWAYLGGVTDGITPTAFAPDSKLKREEFATLLYRYAKEVKGQNVSSTLAGIKTYEDFDTVSEWALDAMAWANDRGLIRGVTAVTLSPRTGATRAQGAAVMMRFSEK